MDKYQFFNQSSWLGMPFYNMPKYYTTFPCWTQPLQYFTFPSIFPCYNFNFWSTMPDYFSRSNSTSTSKNPSNSADKITSVAASYLGTYDNTKAKIMFSSGNHDGGYCADFATFCAKKAYRNYPKSMITPSPETLIEQANNYNIYKSIPTMNKVEWAKQNIKKGNLVITDGNGRSGLHVVIANRVCMKNGKYVLECYSGNDGGGIKLVDYPIETGRYSKKKGVYQMIKGVIDLEKFA